MIPPSLLMIKITSSNGKGFRLWLPLFLLWPFGLLFLLIYILMMPFLYLLHAGEGKPNRRFDTLKIGWELVCALRGLLINVRQKHKSQVFIKII